MYNFIGEYRVKIDNKGRVKLPKNLLRQLDSNTPFPLVVNRGYEKYLMLYPKDVWDKKTKEINQFNITSRNQRNAMRYFYGGASELTPDSIDRVLIPKGLLLYAGIEKDAVLCTYGDIIELWDAEEYKEYIDNEPKNYDEALEKIRNEKAELAEKETKNE